MEIKKALSLSAILIAAWSAAAIAQPLVSRDFVMVSLGDSAASGEGAPNSPATSGHGAVWNDGICHRSDNAPAVLVFNALRAAHPELHFAGDSLGRVKHFACSGAGILNGILGQQTWEGGDVKVAKSQIQQVRDWIGALDPADAHPRVDALIINIGANDMGFEKLVKACLYPVLPDPLQPFPPPRDLNDCSMGTSGALTAAGLAQMDGLYRRLVDTITQQLPDVANVYITEYPDPTHDAAGNFCNGSPFPDLGGLTANESAWASGAVVAVLNQKIANAVAYANSPYSTPKKTTWHMVTGISSQFLTHGACSDANAVAGMPVNRFINTIGDSIQIQSDPWRCSLLVGLSAFMQFTLTGSDPWQAVGDRQDPPCNYSGTMHPNVAGYRAYRGPIVAAITPLFDAPVAPGSLTRIMSPTAIEIDWRDNSTNEDLFEVHYRTAISNWTTVQLPWGSRRWTLGGLTLGQTYTFEARSCSGVIQVCSQWSAITVVHRAPAAPSNLRVHKGYGLYRPPYLQWNDNSLDEDRFELEALDGSTWSSPLNIWADQTIFELGDEPQGGYRVRACISNVCSDWAVTP